MRNRRAFIRGAAVGILAAAHANAQQARTIPVVSVLIL